MIRKYIFVASLFAATCQYAIAQRDTINLVDWQFSRSALSPETALKNGGEWKTVRLPHDFLVEQSWVAPAKNERADNKDDAANVKSRLSSRGFKEMGIGWYRKAFTPDEKWRDKHVELEIGGIMLVGDVYLNGQRIGGTEYGYIGVGIDISRLLKYGQENVLVVKADTRKPENSRWYTGGGLYRDVKFVVTDKGLSFDRHPLYITTSGNNTVNVTAVISNTAKEKTGTAVVKIIDANGKVVATKETPMKFMLRRTTNEYRLESIPLNDAHLWDLDTPYLYTAEVAIVDGSGKVRDRVTEQFGVRTIEYGPDFGFKLNGKKVLFKGIANHHTLGALGAAAYPRAIEKRIKLLKEFGFNHIRCSHNPYSEDLYRLADKYGILVVDEAYDKWLTQYAGGREPWINHWQQDIPEWVQRDRNHPSVVMWSLGNELQQYANLPYNDWGVTPYKLMRTLLKRYDDTRPVTVAMHPHYRNWETDSLPCDLAMVTDIQAYNYRYMYFDGDGKRFPNMTFYQSEANLSTMGKNWFEMNLDKVIGSAYWGMIDYIGESLGWPAKGWNNGVFDLSLRPKPRAWLLKAMFSDSPVVHIGVIDKKAGDLDWNGVNLGADELSDHWNREAGRSYSLYTFTNAEKVELFLNGRSLGVKQNSSDPVKKDQILWENIPYETGTLEAVATNGNKIVARHKIRTAGDVKKLTLEPDAESWKADGIDLMHVRVTAVDKNGVCCPQENGELVFSVDGDAEIVAVDNGDIFSDEPFTGNRRKLHQGSALVVLRAGNKGGKVRLKVTDGKHTSVTALSLVK